MKIKSGQAAGPAGAVADVLDLLPDAVVVLEAGQRIAVVNTAAETMLGASRSELVGRSCAEGLPLRDASGRALCDASPLGRRMPLAKGMPERDYDLRLRDGRFIPVTLRCAYEKDESQVVRRIVCTFRDARARRGMDMRTVELISTVSHEIRSPLTSIKGFTKTLLDRWDRFDDDLKREMLTAVNSDADRVTRLLGELLDISRLEAGRLALHPKNFDLATVASEIAGKVAPQSETHTMRVVMPEELRVFADQDKIQQVLTNLIENAFKYTDGGVVTVSGSVDGQWARVSVADQGEGVPASQIPRLFKKFYRRNLAGSPTGTGLGLYICKGLIEAHGGELTVESVSGRGTTFSFRIPVGRGEAL